MSLYVLLKYVHVVLAIVAIGFNASYGVWLTRARKEPDHALYALRGIKTLDDRFANPAYGLLLLTGVILLAVGGIPWTTAWIIIALVLYVTVVAVAVAGYSPTLRKQIAILEAEGPASDEYRRLTRRGTILGIVLAVIVLLIEFDMVVKPTF
ncbi:MAG TPA: DUF2269 family protein [Chloroflexota bacterium]|nr:DUF2269 family protein [Chloroflexota bacterium]